VRFFGADLPRSGSGRGGPPRTLIRLGDDGAVEEVARPASLPETVAEIARLTGEEPFLLAVDVPVVVPTKNTRSRAVENLLRRRLGHRLEPGGRASLAALDDMVSGESLLAALAATGLACTSYPDRDRRTSGLAEIHPGPVLDLLLWLASPFAEVEDDDRREESLRAYAAPAFRAGEVRGKPKWADRAATLDLLLRALGSIPRYDLDPVRAALADADDEADLDRAVSLFDAVLVGGTLLRYVDDPEACVFVGQRESGYTILPADPFVRRQIVRDGAPEGAALFPSASLREQLSAVARVRSLDLLAVAGRPERLEATFEDPPRYEFDNVDEMLWWKHTRHVAGPVLPVDGLVELQVRLGRDDGEGRSLRLVRSRHRTLSFRFDRPEAWRAVLPTRDGKVHPFRVLRAVYDAR
jgi:predicted RNase H-like nuclease